MVIKVGLVLDGPRSRCILILIYPEDNKFLYVEDTLWSLLVGLHYGTCSACVLVTEPKINPATLIVNFRKLREC